MIRVVFMGTPDFAVPTLRTLIDTQNVVGVVTQPDRQAGRGRQLRPPPVKSVAQESGIPVYQPRSLRSEESARQLIEWQPDIIVVTAFGQILRPHVLELPPSGCLNVHASLLPRWRGASPIQHALLTGDPETGISLMRMDEGMDTGPVYLQSTVTIAHDENAATLHDKLAQSGADLLASHLDDIVAGRLAAIPQDEALATYAPLINKADGEINWNTEGEQLDRHVRAMTPWPSAFTLWNGKPLKILAAQPMASGEAPAGQPGQVFILEGAVVVATKDGGLRLEVVQLAGKPAMPVDDFIRGRPDFAGSRLGS
ncbi:MAG: methionyl-tRNA formyltransferase [Candidatus Promineifilaceae bacterium]